MAPKVTKRPAAAMGHEELEDVTGADLVVEDAKEPGPEDIKASPKKKPACMAKAMPKPKAKGKAGQCAQEQEGEEGEEGKK